MQPHEKPANGNAEHKQPDPIDNAVLLAHIQVAIARVDLAAKEATAAREIAEETQKTVRATKRIVSRIADEYFEQAHGLPAPWRKRFLLLGVAAGISAVTTAATLFLLH